MVGQVLLGAHRQKVSRGVLASFGELADESRCWRNRGTTDGAGIAAVNAVRAVTMLAGATLLVRSAMLDTAADS
jgi:hypothetical protein